MEVLVSAVRFGEGCHIQGSIAGEPVAFEQLEVQEVRSVSPYGDSEVNGVVDGVEVRHEGVEFLQAMFPYHQYVVQVPQPKAGQRESRGGSRVEEVVFELCHEQVGAHGHATDLAVDMSSKLEEVVPQDEG